MASASLDPAQLPVGRERQPAVFPAPLVKLIQREFQQGQAVGAVGRLQQHVVQPGIGLGLDLERQPGGHRRLTNDLPNVGGGRRTEVILPNPVLETHQLGDLAAAPVEIAPQRGDHPHFFVVLDKGGNRIEEPNPLLRNDIDTEELFELIDDQGEPRFRLRLGPGARLLIASRLRKPSLDGPKGRFRRLAEELRQLLRACAVRGQLGQRFGLEESDGQRAKQIALPVAGAQDGPPPQADPFDHAGIGQSR